MSLDVSLHFQSEDQLDNRYNEIPYPQSKDRFDSITRIPSNNEMLFEKIEGLKDKNLPQIFIDMDEKEKSAQLQDTKRLKDTYNGLRSTRVFKTVMRIGGGFSMIYSGYCICKTVYNTFNGYGEEEDYYGRNKNPTNEKLMGKAGLGAMAGILFGLFSCMPETVLTQADVQVRARRYGRIDVKLVKIDSELKSIERNNIEYNKELVDTLLIAKKHFENIKIQRLTLDTVHVQKI